MVLFIFVYLYFADHYVLMGNHHDAWGYGALDPSSGTAAMMEVSRSFGQMLKTGQI